MAELACGRIVWVEMPDPQGKNPKCRPAVIVSAPEALAGATEAWAVGITTQVDSAPPEVSVELPWHRNGHVRTGLRQRSAAVCTWLRKISLDRVQEHAGFVPDRQLFQILGKVGQLPD